MIEDDRELAEIISEFVAPYNIDIKNFENPEIALLELQRVKYDLIILDLSLPNIDGIDVCRKIRDTLDTPIIISSARADITDKTACFSMGADDYMPKPYDAKELILRIQSILRRYNKPHTEEKKSIFEADEKKYEIRKSGELLSLTNAEFEIMSYFIKRAGFAISREEILTNIDAINYDSSLKSIDVIIGRLRHKIEDNPKAPKYIVSIRGVGYKLINEKL
jgi:two-component system OmpR family response regulator